MSSREFSNLLVFVGIGIACVGFAYELDPVKAVGMGMAGAALVRPRWGRP